MTNFSIDKKLNSFVQYISPTRTHIGCCSDRSEPRHTFTRGLLYETMTPGKIRNKIASPTFYISLYFFSAILNPDVLVETRHPRTEPQAKRSSSFLAQSLISSPTNCIRRQLYGPLAHHFLLKLRTIQHLSTNPRFSLSKFPSSTFVSFFGSCYLDYSRHHIRSIIPNNCCYRPLQSQKKNKSQNKSVLDRVYFVFDVWNRLKT